MPGHDEEMMFEGRRFRVVRMRRVGSDGREHIRDIVRHPGAVAILPLLDDGRICLLRNYRDTVGRELIELPAGTREPAEEPAETARRELIEETGYRAGRIELLCVFQTSPGVLDEQMFLYLATELQPGEAAPEPGEELTPLPVTREEARAMIRRGEIEDAKTLVGLLYYEAFVGNVTGPDRPARP